MHTRGVGYERAHIVWHILYNPVQSLLKRRLEVENCMIPSTAPHVASIQMQRLILTWKGEKKALTVYKFRNSWVIILFLVETADLEVLGKVLIVADQVGIETRCHRFSSISCSNLWTKHWEQLLLGLAWSQQQYIPLCPYWNKILHRNWRTSFCGIF